MVASENRTLISPNGTETLAVSNMVRPATTDTTISNAVRHVGYHLIRYAEKGSHECLISPEQQETA
jgi:hypothetical protein